MEMPNDLRISADKAAISLSVICSLHCLLLPIAMALLPSVALFGLNDEWFHRVLLVAVLPVSAFALFFGQRRQKDKIVLTVGAAGLFILIVAALVGHDALGETGERLATVLGSILVATSHIKNFRTKEL